MSVHEVTRLHTRQLTEIADQGVLAYLARRIVNELDLTDVVLAELTALPAEHDRGGGVGTPATNLIFAGTGSKPELVLRDAPDSAGGSAVLLEAEACR